MSGLFDAADDLPIDSRFPVDRVLSDVREATRFLSTVSDDPYAVSVLAKVDRALVRWLSLYIRDNDAVTTAHSCESQALRKRIEESVQSADFGDVAFSLAQSARLLLGSAGRPLPPDVRDSLLKDLCSNDLSGRRAAERKAEEVRSDRDRTIASAEREIGSCSWANYLRERHPEFDGGREMMVVELAGGVSKRTFLVTQKVKDGNKSQRHDGVVVRMDTGNFETSVLDEYPLLGRLHASGMPVAEPLWLEESSEPFGHPFLVTRLLPGSPPGTLFETGDADETAAFAVAHALGALHSTPSELLSDDSVGDARAATARLIDEIEGKWRSIGFDASVPIEIGLSYLKNNLHCVDGPATLVHGECGLQNILLNDGKLTGLLDWEFAHLGDPAEDLAYCRSAVEKVVEWGDFLREYEQSGGARVSVARLEFFDVYCHVRNATLAAEILNSYRNGRVTGINMAVTATDTYARVKLALAERTARLSVESVTQGPAYES